MKFTPRHPGTNVNVSTSHPLTDFAVLAGGLLALVVGLYLLLGLAVDWVVPRLSMDFEKKLVNAFAGQYMDDEKTAETTRCVQAMVDRLQDHCAKIPYSVTVHVHKSDAVNAAALPGGHMVVFTGLIEQMRSENELSFVLAHELGHFAHRDHLRGLGRTLVLMTAATIVFGADNGFTEIIGQGLSLTELSFSRRQETQADEFALQTLDCHYGHVGDATSFFQSIPKSGDPGRFGHYFATHPENQRRIRHMEEVIQKQKYPILPPLPLPPALSVEKHPGSP